MTRIRKLSPEQRAWLSVIDTSKPGTRKRLARLMCCSLAAIDYHTNARTREARRARSRVQSQRAA